MSLLIIVGTALAAATGVRRLRARRPVPNANDTSTIALTTIGAFLLIPILSFMIRAIAGASRNNSHGGLIAFYVFVALLPVVGGLIGILRPIRRRSDPIGIWRGAALGVVVTSLIEYAIALGLFGLLLVAFAHSDWQF